MLHLTIAGSDYVCRESWQEIKLCEAVELTMLINKEIPAKLRDLYALYAKRKSETDEETSKEIESLQASFTDEELIKTFPAFYGSVMAKLTNIPEDVISKITSGHRAAFFNQYCFPFVFGLLHQPTNYEHKRIPWFEFGKQRYYLPEYKQYPGEERPMADRTAIEFTEAADLELFSKELEGGKFERAANIISILCRPKVPVLSNKTFNDLIGEGMEVQAAIKKLKSLKKEDYLQLEPYDEQTCLKRAEEFAELTMDIVWEVFFCCMELSILSIQNIAISFLRQEAQGLQKPEPQAV